MASLTAAEFKERLARELPGALADTPQPAHASENGSAKPPKKGEAGPVNLLATNDAVVHADRIPEVAAYVRETLGYALLSNITAVDYIKDDVIEVIYHFLRLDGGAPLTVKTRVPRGIPIIPSITPQWPGADLQEREAFDLFGVEFEGHPYLRRIYMWDEFEGFPMRKDFPKQGDKYFDQEDD